MKHVTPDLPARLSHVCPGEMNALFQGFVHLLASCCLIVSVKADTPAGKPCSENEQCVVNSECTAHQGGTCECRQGFYANGGVCIRAVGLKRPCRDYGQCVENAECGVDRSGVCECRRGFYASGVTCKQSLALGEACVAKGQCVANAECKSGQCRCVLGFYNYRGFCTRSSRAGEFCASTEECVEGSHCSNHVEYVCVCNQGLVNQNGFCVPLTSRDEQVTKRNRFRPLVSRFS